MEALSPAVGRRSWVRTIAADGFGRTPGTRPGTASGAREMAAIFPLGIPQARLAVLQLHGCVPLSFLHSELAMGSRLTLSFPANRSRKQVTSRTLLQEKLGYCADYSCLSTGQFA